MKRYARVMWEDAPRWIALGDDGTAELMSGTPADRMDVRERRLTPAERHQLRVLPPSEPQKVLGLGYNYKSLVGAREVYDEPVFFLKSPTSICAHQAHVPYPAFATKVWVEVELVIVIGRECRDVSVSAAADHILGYTIGSDITAENIHGRDWHLARSKAIDGFAPLGPHLVTDFVTADRKMYTTINGREYQRGNTSDRIQNDCEIVSCLSRYLTLKPWDLIMTGTPAGATDAVVKRGDVVTHQIDDLGELTFNVA